MNEEEINAHICNCLVSLGDTIANDGKIYYFTGHNVLVWATMTKGVVLWIYEATGTLRNNLPVLIYCKFHNTVKHHSAHIKMVDAFKRWCDTVEEFTDDPLLVFDSLYLIKEWRSYLEDGNVRYLCSIQKSNFPGLVEALKQSKRKLEADDLWAGTNKFTRETSYHHNCPIDGIGHKYLLSNAFSLRPHLKEDAGHIPLFDEYGECFNGCDKFNYLLHTTNYPL